MASRARDGRVLGDPGIEIKLSAEFKLTLGDRVSGRNVDVGQQRLQTLGGLDFQRLVLDQLEVRISPQVIGSAWPFGGLAAFHVTLDDFDDFLGIDRLSCSHVFAGYVALSSLFLSRFARSGGGRRRIFLSGTPATRES